MSHSHLQLVQKEPKLAAGVEGQKQDPKEQIVQHIRKYIKSNKNTSSNVSGPRTLASQVDAASSPEQTEEIIRNLRDFLTYLENKGIINQSKLQNKEEMKNLLKDIMKLDLTKFSKPRSQRSRKRKVHASPVPTSE